MHPVFQKTGEHVGVSKNRGETTQTGVVYNGKPYFLMDDLGGNPTIFGNIHVLKHGFVEKFFPSRNKG